jgi:hypothetical protein
VAVRERLPLARAKDQVRQAGVLCVQLLAREPRLLDVAEAVLGREILRFLEVAVRPGDLSTSR